MTDLPALTCEACGSPAFGVFSSSLGAISFAYCAACNAVGAEPYGFTVGYVATCLGDTPAAVAEWLHEVIAATATRAEKTVAEFWTDVKAEAAKPMEAA